MESTTRTPDQSALQRMLAMLGMAARSVGGKHDARRFSELALARMSAGERRARARRRERRAFFKLQRTQLVNHARGDVHPRHLRTGA